MTQLYYVSLMELQRYFGHGNIGLGGHENMEVIAVNFDTEWWWNDFSYHVKSNLPHFAYTDKNFFWFLSLKNTNYISLKLLIPKETRDQLLLFTTSLNEHLIPYNVSPDESISSNSSDSSYDSSYNSSASNSYTSSLSNASTLSAASNASTLSASNSVSSSSSIPYNEEYKN